MRKLLTLLILLISASLPLHAIGEWTVYNAVPDISRIQYFGDRIYAIAGSSLVSFSTDTLADDLGYLQYSKMEGLTGDNISYITTSDSAHCLVIVYKDCNIDLLYENGEVANIRDVAEKAMPGDKTINNIIEKDGMLYAACSFGFLKIDLDRQLIPISVSTSYPISFAFGLKDKLFRYSAQQGLEYCPTNLNTSDNTNWRVATNTTLKDATVVDTPEGERAWLLNSQGDLLELSSDNNIQNLSQGQYGSIHRLRKGAILTTEKAILYADADTRTATPNYSAPMCSCIDFATGPVSNDVYMLYTDNAIYHSNIISYIPGVVLELSMDFTHVMKASGLNTAYLGDMKVTDDGILGISRRSFITGYPEATSISGAICRFSTNDSKWSSLDIQDAITSRLSSRFAFLSLSGLAIDPTQDCHYAISANLHGLYIMDHDTLVQRYDDLNSNGWVEAFGKDFLSARVSAVTYDDNGNLYYTNSMQDTVLRCITPAGECIKYPNGGMSKVSDARRVLVAKHDLYGFKWVLNDYGYQKSRVGIYYDGGSPANVKSSDYQTAWFSRLIDQDENEYLPYYILDLVEDNNGKIWVLTNLGPFAIEDPKTTFEYAQKNPGMGKVKRIKIPRNDGTNLADYLMESTTCTCMVIDNFNRKWIGTQGAGLYLMSDDCITTIEHFTTENSPLLSDGILALSYDQKSGLLFVSCEGGVLTYQTDAIEGAEDFSGIYCYPNPVRPEYSGELRIMGLMNDSQVSITTASGDLIFRTTSQGATTSYDLRTASGARLDPGIYIVHGVSSDGKKGSICKFLVL